MRHHRCTTPSLDGETALNDHETRRETPRRAALAVGVVVAVAAASIGALAFVTGGAPVEDVEGDGSVAAVARVAGPGRLTLSVGPLCADANGAVDVLAVAAAGRARGLAVTDFGFVAPVRAANGDSGVVVDENASLHENLDGRPVTTRLSAPCSGGAGSPPELVVELRKTLKGIARTRGFDITYRAGGRKHQIFVPYGLRVCEPTGKCDTTA